MHEVEVSIVLTFSEYMYNLMLKIGSQDSICQGAIYKPLPLERVTARALYNRGLLYRIDGDKYEYKYFNHKKHVSCVECYQITKIGKSVYKFLLEQNRIQNIRDFNDGK